ncbi:MAG TPA: hypothetical protein VIU82_21990 [Bosea sp. (in: a-proteobacteria)]
MPSEVQSRIRQFFMSNIGATRTECAAALGIDRRTVWKHIKRMAALPPAAPAEGAAKVKALEWRDGRDAETVFSVVQIAKILDSEGLVGLDYTILGPDRHGLYEVWLGAKIIATRGGEDEAKAAAQADYETRILSALACEAAKPVAPMSTNGEMVERLVWGGPDEQEVEQQAFQAANRSDVPEDVRGLVATLWKQYCLAADPSRIEALEALVAEKEGGIEGERWHSEEAARQRDVWKARALTAEAALAKDGGGEVAVRGELPIWKEGWIASRLSAAMHASLAEYVFSSEEGCDHEPTEFERMIMEDMLNGALSEQSVTDLLQEAAFAMLSASPAPPVGG